MTPNEAAPYLAVGPASHPIPIEHNELTVGRSPDSDVFLDNEKVSRYHAVIQRREGQVLLTDNASSNGTFVNGSRVSGTVHLRDGDRIRFAVVEAVFHAALSPSRPAPPQPWGNGGGHGQWSPTPTARHDVPSRPPTVEPAAIRPLGPPPAQPRPGAGPARPGTAPGGPPAAALERLGDAPILLSEGEIALGRVPGNDVVLNDSRVSSHHARIVHQEDAFVLIDLQSSNGTYVNGQRIAFPWTLEDGDEVVMGESEFIFRRLRKLPKKRKGAPRAPGARPTGPGPKT